MSWRQARHWDNRRTRVAVRPSQGPSVTLDRGGLTLIHRGGRKLKAEKVLGIARYAQDGRTLKVSLTLADGREVALSIKRSAEGSGGMQGTGLLPPQSRGERE
jgi:hypothetical protein